MLLHQSIYCWSFLFQSHKFKSFLNNFKILDMSFPQYFKSFECHSLKMIHILRDNNFKFWVLNLEEGGYKNLIIGLFGVINGMAISTNSPLRFHIPGPTAWLDYLSISTIWIWTIVITISYPILGLKKNLSICLLGYFLDLEPWHPPRRQQLNRQAPSKLSGIPQRMVWWNWTLLGRQNNCIFATDIHL